MTVHDPVCQAMYDLFSKPKGTATNDDWAKVWKAVGDWKRFHKRINVDKTCVAADICMSLSKYDKDNRSPLQRHYFWTGIRVWVSYWAKNNGLEPLVC